MPVRLFESAVRQSSQNCVCLTLHYLKVFVLPRLAEQVLSGYDIFYERMGWVGYGGALAADWLKIPTDSWR